MGVDVQPRHPSSNPHICEFGFLLFIKKNSLWGSPPPLSFQKNESLTFCARYLDDCITKLNRAPRHDDNPGPSVEAKKYLRIIGRPLSAFAAVQLDYNSWTRAQRCVLVNYLEIEKYTIQHKNFLTNGRRKSKRAIETEHHNTFYSWFVDHVSNLKCIM
jgi:hypothetical protein